jgi:hypothetical protein
MTVKELINQLSSFDEDELVRFYFLQGGVLNGCELETIIKADTRVEFTIQDDEEAWEAR